MYFILHKIAQVLPSRSYDYNYLSILALMVRLLTFHYQTLQALPNYNARIYLVKTKPPRAGAERLFADASGVEHGRAHGALYLARNGIGANIICSSEMLVDIRYALPPAKIARCLPTTRIGRFPLRGRLGRGVDTLDWVSFLVSDYALWWRGHLNFW